MVLGWNLKQKELIQCYAYTNVANRIVFSFVWRKFSSVGIGEWWDELKNGQKLKLGDAHASPQEIFKKYKHQSLGMPPEAPPSSSAKIRSPFKTLYFYCFMHYAFFLERCWLWWCRSSESLCVVMTSPLGTPRGRYDECSGKFSLS
jgi:hypothetical protein